MSLFIPVAYAADLTTEDVVAKHLDSIGSADARNAKSRITEGAVTYNKDRSTAAQIPDPTNEKGFRKVAIITGISNGAKTEILKGLTEGQQVILQ